MIIIRQKTFSGEDIRRGKRIADMMTGKFPDNFYRGLGEIQGDNGSKLYRVGGGNNVISEPWKNLSKKEKQELADIEKRIGYEGVETGSRSRAERISNVGKEEYHKFLKEHGKNVPVWSTTFAPETAAQLIDAEKRAKTSGASLKRHLDPGRAIRIKAKKAIRDLRHKLK